MVSSEFLLFLITVIIAIYLIIHYFKEEVRNNQMYAQMSYPMGKNDMQRLQYRQPPTNVDYDEEPPKQSSASSRQENIDGYRPPKQRLNVRVNNGNNGMPHIDPLRKFDYDAMYDELTPPFRRSYYDEDIPLMPGMGRGGIYTRGPPGRFRKIGTLIAQGSSHNDKYKFMNLLGREKYPGRDYEYYCTTVDHESKLKIYIETKGKEIRDGDAVQVPELAGYNYIFKEDKDMSPLYDPYIV